MSTRIKDITLLKFIGKGSFGTVYLSKKDGKSGYFATKQIERSMADKPGYYKYFENELRILKDLHHPNIVHLEDVKKDDKYYYIVMEFVNGGSLTDCLKKYQMKYGKSFPEEIVQYLMRQIVDAIKFIHKRNIIHRDLKLDNIMVNFDNDNDKNNLNMMRAKVKIIDFGFATKLTPDKNNLAQTALGSPINMDPLILNVMAKKGKDLKQLGYDDKADIWSLGTICYELLIGKTVFNAETMNDLVQKVESGNYHVPTSLSREMVSFLNSMLQYDGSKRLNAEELSKHAFLTKDVRNFTKINTRQVQRKIDNKGLNINIKRNQTIWSIFNEEDEQKLIGINDGNNAPMKPIPEYPQDNTAHKRHNTDKNVHKMIIINKNYGKSNSNNYPFVGQPTSIY
jgi:serine/threonine protein kinase